MLDAQCIDIEERLRPMLIEALKTQSFGLQIMAYGMVRSMIPTPNGPIPAWGLYYQARGTLLGPKNYVAQMTLITDPYATQDEINEAFAEGAASLREQVRAQGIIGNGQAKP